MDQAAHQIHQGRLAGAVRTNQAGDARWDREVHPIHTEHVAIELGDVFEDHLIVGRHYRTTSNARTFLLNNSTHMAHITSKPAQALQAEMSMGDSTPNISAHTRDNSAPGLI